MSLKMSLFYYSTGNKSVTISVLQDCKIFGVINVLMCEKKQENKRLVAILLIMLKKGTGTVYYVVVNVIKEMSGQQKS